MHKGSCLCSAVTFEVAGDLTQPVACHCTQCRKQSGHYWAAADVATDQITIFGEDNLTWYAASAKARRGFCKTCGSFLFWDPADQPRIDIAMGAFETPLDVKLDRHIFVSDKGDYYDITDGLPKEG
jgi:hypothetical protein